VSLWVVCVVLFYLCRVNTYKAREAIYKVVQIWPGQTVTCLHTNSPGHIWTTLHVWRNTEARSRNHCCHGKAVSIKYLCVCALDFLRACVCPGALACACACVHVALLIQHATCIRHVVTSFVWLRRIFRHCPINGKVFEKKKVAEHSLIFSTTLV
jgi:hypothetical protein